MSERPRLTNEFDQWWTSSVHSHFPFWALELTKQDMEEAFEAGQKSPVDGLSPQQLRQEAAFWRNKWYEDCFAKEDSLGAEFAARLDAINEDPERSHLAADLVLLEFARALAPNVATAWEKCKARTGGWWYA